ncbi:MAG: HAD hydrolase family protein [Ignavibacteriales bacterium]|nr:HAD hydrolase family protein [Ignavibacteriales bacterium]
MTKKLISRLKKIKLLATDVDGVLTDSGMYYLENGEEMKKFNSRDGMGMVLLREYGIRVAIITREDTKLVERRAIKLKITDLFQGVRDKEVAMETLMKRHSLTWDDVAFIGDDVNDLELLKRVGFAAAPADAAPQNRKIVHYVTQKKGGEGCVREICDMLLEINNASIIP